VLVLVLTCHDPPRCLHAHACMHWKGGRAAAVVGSIGDLLLSLLNGVPAAHTDNRGFLVDCMLLLIVPVLDCWSHCPQRGPLSWLLVLTPLTVDSVGPTEKIGAGADSVVLEPIGKADVVGEVDQFIYW
jgi:hypothetical protein